MSNRSLAAARSRRSPQEIVNEQSFKKPSPQMPQSNQQTNVSQEKKSAPTQNNKLSIGDAIGLITIRLSKIEAQLMKEQNSENESEKHNNGTSTDIDTIMRSLVSRVNILEKTHESTNKNIEQLNISMEELTENNNEVNSQPAQDSVLIEMIEKNQREISDLKQLVIRLQTMFIETTISSKLNNSNGFSMGSIENTEENNTSLSLQI
jgi:hypothetical protein